MLAYSLRMPEGMKRCAKCGETKSLDGFHRSASGHAGRASRCRECRNKDSREYAARRHAAELKAEERWQEVDASCS